MTPYKKPVCAHSTVHQQSNIVICNNISSLQNDKPTFTFLL